METKDEQSSSSALTQDLRQSLREQHIDFRILENRIELQAESALNRANQILKSFDAYESRVLVNSLCSHLSILKENPQVLESYVEKINTSTTLALTLQDVDDILQHQDLVSSYISAVGLDATVPPEKEFINLSVPGFGELARVRGSIINNVIILIKSGFAAHSFKVE